MLSLGQKLTLKWDQLLLVATFLTDRPNLSQNSTMSRKFSDDFVRIIWELFKDLVQFPLTIRKREFDIFCKRLYLRLVEIRKY